MPEPTNWIIEIPGVPVPKGRPKFTRTGRAYTPTKTRQYENDIRTLARARMQGLEPMSGPIRLELVAYLPYPLGWPKWKTERVTGHGVFVAHTVKPDFDNLAKIVDALKGIVWLDDSQITDSTIRKRYSKQPRLVLAIEQDPHAVHSKTKRKPGASAKTTKSVPKNDINVVAMRQKECRS